MHTPTEAWIAQALVHRFWQRAVLALPNTYWTGHECDILVVPKCMRVIDVEIKVTRSDLKADALKAKWRSREYRYAPHELRADLPKAQWPTKTWKHYYAMPEQVWDDSLFDVLPSKNSGVILIRPGRFAIGLHKVVRRARSNPEARELSPAQILDLARLGSLKLWNLVRRIECSDVGSGPQGIPADHEDVTDG